MKRHERVEDVEVWEAIGYAWLVDILEEVAREEAWHRFCYAYPEAARETHQEFWKRICTTQWHHKHHHRYEGGHEYGG